MVAGVGTPPPSTLDIPTDSGFDDFATFDSSFSDSASLYADGSAPTSSGPAPPTLATEGGSLGLVNALRDFLGGDVAMLLPLIVALGALALVAGPILTVRARRPVPATVTGGEGTEGESTDGDATAES